MSGYNWTVTAGGTITAGLTTNEITVSWNMAGAQTVSVNYYNGDGCTAASAAVFAVSVNPLPVPTITGESIVCESSDYYTYTTEAGMSDYNWSIAPNSGTLTWTPGSNEVLVFWNASGAQWVSVSYTNPNGCTVPNATVLDVTVQPVPGAAGFITGASTLCAGSTAVAYTIDPVSEAISYDWTVPTGATIVNGAGTNSILVDYGTDALSGWVTVKGINSCGAGDSSYVAVTVNPLPSTPVISQSGNILTSDASTGNQWFRNGSYIPGATAQNYEAVYNGDYYVIVTQNACSSGHSNIITVVITGMDNEAGKQEVNIYPNPNSGRFNIDLTSEGQEVFTLRIFTEVGACVYEKNGIVVNGTWKEIVDRHDLPSGVYYVVLNNGSRSIFHKIIVK